MKAVILAAGEGTRLKPLTNTTPKCMLQVAGKPILHHLIERLKEAGVKDAIIIVKHLKEKVIDYFKGKKLGVKLTFVEQTTPYGTGSALLSVKNKIKSKFLMIAGDIILDSSIIKKIIKSHKSGITLALREVKNPHGYGIATLNSKGKVISFEEKPKSPKSNLTNISVYCFDPSIFKKLEKLKSTSRGEVEITDCLVGALGVVVKKFWMSVEYPWHLFRANEHMIETMEDHNKGSIENSTIKGKVILEKGAKIINSFIEGNVYIGKNTIIGPNAHIRGTTSIGENCSIGGGSTIKNSILFNNVNAKHLSYIGDSIIGNNVNFGSGTQIANYRFDSSTINVLTKKGWVNSGRNKFGCVVGDDTKFGVLSCTMPGKLIGNNCWISSGVIVNRNVKPNTRVFVKQEHTFMKQEKEKKD